MKLKVRIRVLKRSVKPVLRGGAFGQWGVRGSVSYGLLGCGKGSPIWPDLSYG